jgi:hypothetical protein
MLRWLKADIKLYKLLNPFFIYVVAFLLSIFFYLWNWSDLYPALSPELILFFIISFIIFISTGLILRRKIPANPSSTSVPALLKDVSFIILVILGIINILIEGYIPILDNSHDYRQFGAPVVDVLFNTFSIFLSLVLFQSFLTGKVKRHLLFVILILIFQIFLYRRSTIVWIVVSSSLMYILNKKTIKSYVIILLLFIIPFLSYSFGYYGNIRSNLTETYVREDLKSSLVFKELKISHTHYMTYLYISSPLANLQNNIRPENRFINRGNFKEALFYCIVPQSLTLRLGNKIGLSSAEVTLIHPHLIAGTCYMNSYSTLGWMGMIILTIYILLFITISLYIINKWKTFGFEIIPLLITTVALLIFDNMLVRFDTILILIIYPVFFHYISEFAGRHSVSVQQS